MDMVRWICLSSLLPICLACSTPILEPEQTLTWNEELKERVFRASKDIYPEFANQSDRKHPLFPRGTLLKLQIESSPDWVKVRAREAKSQKENTPGQVILYVFREEVESESGNGRQIIEEQLNQMVSPAN